MQYTNAFKCSFLNDSHVYTAENYIVIKVPNGDSKVLQN